ncbi:hypothetical protein B0H10DRAFT_1754638, partial [Mycena sp. CBHHK59/15]
EPEEHVEDDPLDRELSVEELQTAKEFILALRAATLENGDLDADAIHRLRNPMQQPTSTSGTNIFIFPLTSSSPAPHNLKPPTLSLERTSHVVSPRAKCSLTITSILNDMCHKSCVAFTGPYTELKTCPKCGESRYDPVLEHSRGQTKVSRWQFHTILLGPQLQAM